MNVAIEHEVYVKDTKLWNQLIATFKLKGHKMYLLVDTSRIPYEDVFSKFEGVIDLHCVAKEYITDEYNILIDTWITHE